MFHSAPSGSSTSKRTSARRPWSGAIVLLQIGVNVAAQRFDLGPLLVGVGHGDARRFIKARHASSRTQTRHSHSSTAPVMGAALWGSGVQASGMWPSPASKPEVGSRPIQPAAGQIHFAPGVQIGEILFRAAGAVERFDVRLELDQIAADKARGQAAMPEQLASSHAESRHEPLALASVSSGVCTPGSRRMVYLMSFHRRWLTATRKSIVRGRASPFSRRAIQPACAPAQAWKSRREFAAQPERRQFMIQDGRVGKRKPLGFRFEEKIERIEHRHLRHQVHFHSQFACRLLKNQPGEVIRLRILLPVDEMLLRPHA